VDGDEALASAALGLGMPTRWVSEALVELQDEPRRLGSGRSRGSFRRQHRLGIVGMRLY
jgi:hypothetical protein